MRNSYYSLDLTSDDRSASLGHIPGHQLCTVHERHAKEKIVQDETSGPSHAAGPAFDPRSKVPPFVVKRVKITVPAPQPPPFVATMP
jgi:hypothetical protein